MIVLQYKIADTTQRTNELNEVGYVSTVFDLYWRFAVYIVLPALFPFQLSRCPICICFFLRHLLLTGKR